jgi:hypothetical protein
MGAIKHFQTRWSSMLGLMAMGLITTLASGCQILSNARVGSTVDLVESPPLTIIGQAEYVTILPLGMTQKARIDTGATTCSIHASSIKRFERDGEKWVRFELGPEQDAEARFEVERPLVRIASIKRHGSEDQTRPVVRLTFKLGPEQDSEERFEVERPIVRIANIKRHGAKDQTRPVVRLTFKLGTITDTIEFSLTDRSAFEFPILVGRNLLSGNALVDVTKHYTTRK